MKEGRHKFPKTQNEGLPTHFETQFEGRLKYFGN